MIAADSKVITILSSGGIQKIKRKRGHFWPEEGKCIKIPLFANVMLQIEIMFGLQSCKQFLVVRGLSYFMFGHYTLQIGHISHLNEYFDLLDRLLVVHVYIII